jgi:multidrug efflux pump subunit AcrA (membrane-fusion protein)
MQYVFTVEEDRAKKVRVKAGDIISDRIEITEGLREGMIILTDNLDKLKEGNLVQLGAEE